MKTGVLKVVAALSIAFSGLSAFIQASAFAGDTKLSGTSFGTSPAWSQGSEFDKAVDGSKSTFFDYSQGYGGYTGIDLGEGVAQSVSKIRFYPRAGYEIRMKCGKFQGSNTSSSAGFVDLASISSTPCSGTWTEVCVTSTVAYRYLRYLGPANGFCNIAEMEFYTGVAPVTYEAENLCRTSSAAGTDVSTGDPNNSNSAYVQFASTACVGDWIEFTVPCVKAGTYTVKMYFKANNNRGICQGSIDGVNLGGTCDEYAPGITYKNAFDLGRKTLADGNHKLRFTIAGRNPASSSFAMTIDKIEIVPVFAPAPVSGIAQISAGHAHRNSLLADGTLWACGWNYYGQLGDGTTSYRQIPFLLMSGVQSVSSGERNTLILKTDGTLWACGDNQYGEIGDGTTIHRLAPVMVMAGVQGMVSGSLSSFMIKTDGTLWSCGYNAFGQLCDGTTADRSTPVQVMSGVMSVLSKNYFTLVLKTDNTLWGCGMGFCGNLGDGTGMNQPVPIQIMSDVRSMAAGFSHSLILKTDNTLWSCGDNGSGQLGDGTNDRRLSPVLIMSDVQSISAGADHSLMVKTDGSLWACGYNGFGQLGDGTTINRNTPVQVMTDVQNAVAGGSCTVILKKDGTLWACGNNNWGTLGDGTLTDRWLPVQVNP